MSSMQLPFRCNKYHRILLSKIYSPINDILKSYFVYRFRKYIHLYSFTTLEEAYETIGSTYMVLVFCVIINGYKRASFDILTVLEDNFYFTMMYSLVDTLLDTNNEHKIKNIKSIKSIIYDGQKEDNSPLINALYEIYLHFINREEVISSLKTAFEAEYLSYLIQYNKCNEDQYKKVCEDLGYTMYALFKSINNISGVEEYDRIIGYVGQLCDNIIDIDDDIKSAINTIATFVYQRDGNVDLLYYDTIKMIERLPNDEEYYITKFSLMYGFYFMITKCRYISNHIKNEIKDYTFRVNSTDINKELGKEIYDSL